ncbi:MAG: mechanosensitive ion channel family protein [Nitriliruptorales bacterium]
MERLGEFLLRHETATQRWASTLAVLILAAILHRVARSFARRRLTDAFHRYYAQKAITYLFIGLVVVAISIIWSAFAGRVGVVLGLVAAGVAFAMQEVIGALAGWVNIVIGRIYHVGDRIEMAEGVRGDVLDVTPLRTKILEIGSEEDESEEEGSPSWVRGRQYTGRVVAVSNKATFTDPVYNYTAIFEYIWEEINFPISYRSDWQRAEEVIQEEVNHVSASLGAQEAMRTMYRRYPVPMAEVKPRVFVRATESWMELAARFVVPVRTARSVKDQLTRRVYERLAEAGVEIASETIEATLRLPHSSADIRGEREDSPE